MAQLASRRRLGKILPPRWFQLSLIAQLPAIGLAWPLAPSRAELGLGLAAMAAGLALNLWAGRSFKHWQVGVPPFSPTPHLIEDGPFRFSRNPMYLGMVLFSAGMALATGVVANLVFAAALAAWLHYGFILPEEAFLERNFGSSFALYCRRIPRWIGWPRG